MSEIEARRKYTEERIQSLQECVEGAKGYLGENACIYATGSFGRLEASKGSDLDAFIVSKPRSRENASPPLSQLNEICVKAELIEAIRKLGIPDFDGDGRYLVHYPVADLTKNLGTQKDDVENTLTSRLLLFLESRPLLGGDIYKIIIDDVIAEYWRDFKDHKNDFMPAFLSMIFCVCGGHSA